ncbi:MAG TPA: hypothetical protein VK281_04450 [Xanthobacteraceae bacterium]|nr:hypothetical protein [Xanthobacteraceae bacterium]
MARDVRPVDNRKSRGHQGVHTDDQHVVGPAAAPPAPVPGEKGHGGQPAGAPEHASPPGHGKHAGGHKGQAEKIARDKKHHT